MKKYLAFLFMLLLIFSLHAEERKKVGLVLGGGGARGMAHISVLKVLEEAGIPIDYIAGTSIGSIVGGLYAIGYSPEEIERMVKEQNWEMLLSDRVKRNIKFFPEKENSERYIVTIPINKDKKAQIQGVIKGQNLYNLFSDLTIGYHDSIDFNKLNIPFACVSVDLVSGKEYVFHKGSLPLAMRSSMAIPAAFTPVRIDSMVLVDGGLKNNFPVDVVRAMGAEIVIGVDLSSNDLMEIQKISSPVDVITQIVALYGHDKYAENKAKTDLLLRPDLVTYNFMGFTPSGIDTVLARGTREARSKWDEIIALKKKIGITDDTPSNTVEIRKQNPPVQPSDTFHIRKIYLKGIDPRDEKWMLQICKLKENSPMTLQQLQKAMSILVGTNAYSTVNYKLTGEDQQDLILTLEPKTISAANFGIRFDSEEILGVLFNATLDYRRYNNSKFAFTGRVGSKTSFARLDYMINRSPLRGFNVAYQFAYNDFDIFNKGDKIFSTTYLHHFAELGYSDMNWMSFKFKVGVRYEYFNYNSFLYVGDNMQYHVKPEGFFSYFGEANFETFDKRYFPQKGLSVQAAYSLYTDNFVGYNGGSAFSALSVKFMNVVPISSRLSLLPSVYGRVLIGNDPAYPYLNVIGGESFGRYVPQQIPFAGISNFEIAGNSVMVARLQLRQRIAGNNYISLIGNYGISHDRFFRIFDGESLWGGSLGYAYDSLAGPLSATFGMSNRNKHLQFYLNLGFIF